METKNTKELKNELRTLYDICFGEQACYNVKDLYRYENLATTLEKRVYEITEEVQLKFRKVR